MAWLNILLVVLGASFTLAFAPYDYWYVVFAAFPLVVYLIAFHAKSVFKSTWCFGLGYFGAGISWVHVSIADFGGLPLLASIALMIILCGYLALFPALSFKILDKYFDRKLWPLAIPFTWFATEWLRANFLSGFPWLSIAYSQSNSILSAWLPVVGEIGLSILIVATCTAMALGIRRNQYGFAFLPIFVLVVSAFTLQQFTWTKVTGQTKKVALVQGNIPQSIRWDPERDKETLQIYENLSTPLWENDIIIWPESAIPTIESLSQDFIAKLDQQATLTNTGLITGVVSYNLHSGQAFNLLIALGIDEKSNKVPYELNHSKRFSKHHLLPIGEFVPFENLLRPLAPIFDLPMSSFSRGDYVQPNLIASNTSFAPAICFEIAFPQQILANITAKTQAIITVSNDAWFADSHGPHQHLQIAQVRAKEFGLPVLRATNNGVTAIIDHQGIIQSQLPQFEALALIDTLKLVEGSTPYRDLGNWPLAILSFISFLLAIYFRQYKTLK